MNQDYNILDHREYNIKIENDEYNLRIEIDKEYAHFILSKIDKQVENIYKNKMDLITIVNILALNSSKYSNLELILNIFDNFYEKNKIFIKINDDNSCNLLIKIINMFEDEVVKEIKLYKEYMNIEDKFNLLYNKIKTLNIPNINNNNHIAYNNENENENIKNKLNELSINMSKREKEIKEINDKLLKLEKEKENEKEIKVDDEKINEIINKKMEEIEKKLYNDFNEKINNIKNNFSNNINNQNDLIKKINDRTNINNNENNKNNIQISSKKYNELIENIKLTKKLEKEIEKINKGNKNINQQNNNLINNYVENNNSDKEIELIKEDIKKMYNKIKNNEKEIIKINNILKEKELIINKINEKIISHKNVLRINVNKDNIGNKIRDLNNSINYKYNELNDKINHNEYLNKINYIFKKEPQNLKYQLNITDSNTSAGWNDIFEIFVSYKDNKEYLISPNIHNYNLDIFDLLDNKKIKSLKEHDNNIRSIRYFINKNSPNYNEYLISADDNKIVIIWDITDNYNIKYQIDTQYGHNIYSCLLIFPHNLNDNYIITSTYYESDNIDNSSTKVYSLNNNKYIKYIENTNNLAVYYLLSWYNKKNNKYYLIQFSYKKIIINNFIEDELYTELVKEPEDNHFSGFIYNKDDNDYLYASSSIGYINIWDLYNKKIFKVIYINNCKLAHIIQWNNKFILVADYNNKSFKIVDIEKYKFISDINGQHIDKVVCVKKLYHPVYGESLLSAGRDKTIKLWTI